MNDLPANRPKPLPRSNYANRLGEFPDFTFAERAAFAFRGTWRDLFRRRIGPASDGRVILEIGCFNAVFLSGIAAKYPNTTFIGLDWKCKAIYDGAARAAGLGLDNIALLRARAHDVLRIFAEGELDEIWIFHPERPDGDLGQETRLIDERFLADVHTVLRHASSILAFKTDQPEYYQWMLDLCGKESIHDRFAVSIASANYWNDPAAIAHASSRCFAGEVTVYEARFIKKRLPIYYLEMRKK